MKTAIPPRSFHPQYKAELIMIFDRCKYISDLCKTLNRSIAWINKVYDSETVKLKMSDQIPPTLADKLMDYWFGELPSLSEEEKLRYKLQSQTKTKKRLPSKTKKQSIYDKVSIFGIKSIKYYPVGGKKNK